MSLLLCGSCIGFRSQREYSTSCACLCTRCSSDTLLITLPACWCPPLTFLHGRRCVRRVTVTWSYQERVGRLVTGLSLLPQPHAWNRLPTDLKLSRTTTSFKSKLKSFLFQAAYTGNIVWTLECGISLIVGAHYKSLLLLLLFCPSNGANILPKSSSLCLGCNNITDDRQTDDRRTAHAKSRT